MMFYFVVNQQIEVTYLLKILKNDLNINEKKYIKFLLTLKALGENIQGEMLKILFSKRDFFKRKNLNLLEIILLVILF